MGNDYKHFLEPLNGELSAESDRSCAIVSASLADDCIGRILRAHLAPNPTSNDTIFDGPNAPLGTLSVKIDMSYRLGLISARLAGDLHKLRKIRNEFAHSFEPRKFEDSGIRDRVLDLTRSVGLKEREPELARAPYDSIKGEFILTIIFLMITLQNLLELTKPLSAASSNAEDLYSAKITVGK